ncbi:MAG TPA: pilus assembly protein N-terminal domain-containing protein [Parvibaculum sp.]
MSVRRASAEFQIARSFRRSGCGLIGAAFAALALTGPAHAADLHVQINEMRSLHLAAPAETVIVGNPAIADVSVQSSQLIYVLGKTYGKTNLIALDSTGKQIAQMNIDVVAQTDSTVTVTRGAGQVTYNCTPRCERVINPTDSKDDFDQAVKQAGDAAGLGLGAAAATSGGGSNAQ